MKPFTKIKIEGLHNLPADGGIVIAPNHVSLLDPVLLGVELSPVRPIRALAKESLFRTPVIGFVLTHMGHIPVYRNSDTAVGALTSAIEALKDGKAVAVYPEGTIPENLTTTGKFKTGTARAAIIAQTPVVLVAQWGAQNLLPSRTKNAWKYLFKGLTRKQTHYVKVSEPINPPIVDVENEKEFWEAVHSFTEELHTKLDSMMKNLRVLAPAHPEPVKKHKHIYHV